MIALFKTCIVHDRPMRSVWVNCLQ